LPKNAKSELVGILRRVGWHSWHPWPEDRHQARGVVVVWNHSDEREDSAVARWMAARPGDSDPRTAAALTVYLVSWQREWAAEGATASSILKRLGKLDGSLKWKKMK
jgi:hypothetical protein